MYSYSVLGYISQYYYDWSRLNSKYFATTTKDLVYVINKYSQSGKSVIISGARPVTVLHFAFYNKIDANIIQNKINFFPVSFGNITFTKECRIKSGNNPYALISPNTVYISSTLCSYGATPSANIATYGREEVAWNIYFKK
jgi:hypothetical protein